MKAFTKEKKLLFLVGVILCALTFVLCITRALFSLDKVISDPLVQEPQIPDPRIKIIAIDEKTMAEYGDTRTWNRSIYADLTEVLNSGEHKPAVIAYDILFISDMDPEIDGRFADACQENGNVVTASNLVFRDHIDTTGNGFTVDSNVVDMVEYPYDALNNVVSTGFANTVQQQDGYIRSAKVLEDIEDGHEESFAVAIYKKYCDRTGESFVLPETYGDHLIDFSYTGQSGSYEILSLCDVLNGNIPVQAFSDAIVFVGAYAPGMQDAYNVPIQKGEQMYGVEIHANILQAIMDGRTGKPINTWIYALIVTLIVLAFYIISEKTRPDVSLVVLIVLIAGGIFAIVKLNRNGITTPIIDLPIMLLLTYAYQLIRGYMKEKLNKKKVLDAFKQYVAPQVVDQISKTGDFEIRLGGESRHVAVLFVDIRGFTPMSEGLEPEEVVGILNEYLALTTDAIFKNGGTLDKFIGDATMAVFNSPFDLDDYIYRAVCTARDIAAGSDALSDKLMEKFGRKISFGIGVHCGNAVVGNIGCDFRMDYTAIGDTVNTAARLEANAGRGQILISQEVYEAVKDRVEVTDIGVIPLKGKTNQIYVYQVDNVK